ncbi:unnamed protein product [Microthlaspi erraticum]|uniref:Uncharacterized protein n=1 Tax=Microthlaspi erraticum TaxID=1685480 RepID=A0A6D2IUX2_9BRAS|nr:unnamed protein product [Microthlaspi erraticum]
MRGCWTKKKSKLQENIEDEDSDTTMLHLLVTMIGLAQLLIAHQYFKFKGYIEYPIRRSITGAGYDYIHNVLQEDPQTIVSYEDASNPGQPGQAPRPAGAGAGAAPHA